MLKPTSSKVELITRLDGKPLPEHFEMLETEGIDCSGAR